MGNPINFKPLRSEQTRQLVDVQQVYDALREADAALAGQFSGTMRWRTVKGKAYLYRIRGKVEKSIGPRSPGTEALEQAFQQGRERALGRQQSLRERLTEMAPVNIALRLNRVPDLVARIIRRLDAVGLLGPRVVVVGANAMFAYEARAGVHLDSALLATADVDFALDARRSLVLATNVMPGGLVGLLQQIDPSFAARRAGDFRAVNDEGFMVDLITSAHRDPLLAGRPKKVSSDGGDMAAAEIGKLQWLIEAPRFEATTVANNGLPLRIAVPDPRFFAAHKLWLADREDRDPQKRARDRDQALAVAAFLAAPLSNLKLDDAALSQLPAPLRAGLRAAVSQAPPRPEPIW